MKSNDKPINRNKGFLYNFVTKERILNQTVNIHYLIFV